MLRVTVGIVCNPLYLRHVNINLAGFNFICTGAAFLYPIIYILTDAIAFISTRKIAILLVMFSTLCDGLYSLLSYAVTTLSMPLNLSDIELAHNNAINIIGAHILKLFIHGFLASVIAAIVELLIFIYFLGKLHSFILSTMTSIIITLAVHNTITDSIMLRNGPNKWFIIVTNLGLNITIMLIYSIIISFLISINKRYKITKNY